MSYMNSRMTPGMNSPINNSGIDATNALNLLWVDERRRGGFAPVFARLERSHVSGAGAAARCIFLAPWPDGVVDGVAAATVVWGAGRLNGSGWEALECIFISVE